MAYIYESIQNGVFNFTIPGKDKSVKLLKGSRVKVDKKLSGGYLRVLKFIKEVPDKEPEKVTEVVEKDIKPQAKVEDKIIKVEEKVESSKEEAKIEVGDDMLLEDSVNIDKEDLKLKAEDTVVSIKEEEPKKTTTRRKTPAKK